MCVVHPILIPATTMLSRCVFVLSFFFTSADCQLQTLSASDPRVSWVGRRAVLPSGAVVFDYEGVSATVNITGLGVLLANISDSCAGGPVGGGSRWLVTYTPNDPRTVRFQRPQPPAQQNPAAFQNRTFLTQTLRPLNPNKPGPAQPPRANLLDVAVRANLYPFFRARQAL